MEKIETKLDKTAISKLASIETLLVKISSQLEDLIKLQTINNSKDKKIQESIRRKNANILRLESQLKKEPNQKVAQQIAVLIENLKTT